jgi:hypothetical protein
MDLPQAVAMFLDLVVLLIGTHGKLPPARPLASLWPLPSQSQEDLQSELVIRNNERFDNMDISQLDTVYVLVRIC